MKKFENKDIGSEQDKNSLSWLPDKDIASKFDKQMDKLKNIAKAEAKEQEDADELIDNINDFFEKAEKVDNDLENNKEIKKEIGKKSKRTRTVKKYTSIENRNIDVQNAIKESWESVLDEILNWKEEKNPVAKSLLGIANWILKTEE